MLVSDHALQNMTSLPDRSVKGKHSLSLSLSLVSREGQNFALKER